MWCKALTQIETLLLDARLRVSGAPGVLSGSESGEHEEPDPKEPDNKSRADETGPSARIVRRRKPPAEPTTDPGH